MEPHHFHVSKTREIFHYNGLHVFCVFGILFFTHFCSAVGIHHSVVTLRRHAGTYSCFPSRQVARLPRMRTLSRELLLEILDALAEEMPEVRLCQDLSTASGTADG